MDFKFPKAERIRLDREVRAVLDEGNRVSGECLVLNWSLGAGQSSPRMALRVPKSVGSAPERNRWKRLLREVFRREKSNLRSGANLLWMVRSRAKGRKPGYAEVRKTAIELFRKAGLWAGPSE